MIAYQKTVLMLLEARFQAKVWRSALSSQNVSVIGGLSDAHVAEILAEIQKALESKYGHRPEIHGFSEYLALRGAHSFTLEVPKQQHGYMLDERVEMNLIATDRLLARYYLNI